MVKKLYSKGGIFLIQPKELTMKQCYFIVNNYQKETSYNDYLLQYYQSKGFCY